MPPTLPSSSHTSLAARRFTLSAAEMQDWLACLPLHNTPEAARCIVEQLGALNRSRTPLRERLVFTALLRDCAERLLPELEGLVAGAQIPLPPRLRAVARLIDDLLREFVQAYKHAVIELPVRWFSFGLPRRLHPPITRALQMTSRRLVLAHRIYAPSPPGAWLEMHELFSLARHHHIDKLSLSGAHDSPLAIYRGALALSFASPPKLMQGELDQTRDFLTHNGDLAVFIDAVPADPVDGLFVVQQGRDGPGIPWGKRSARSQSATLGADELVLNTARLADRAMQVADGIQETPDGSANASASPELLRRLVRHWTAAAGRQYSRLRRHSRVDLCVGLHGIWRFLREPGADGRVQMSEWMVKNESPGGFALMHVSGPVESVKVGEVLGVRSRDSDRVHICVVRWVLSDSAEHVELGLEELSPNAKPISIARLATSGGIGPRSEPGLLLPEIPALNREATILALPGSVDANIELDLGEPGQRVRATHLVEQTLSLELFRFRPVN